MQKLEAGKVFEMMDFGSLSMVSFLLLLSSSFSPLTTVNGRGPTRVTPPRLESVPDANREAPETVNSDQHIRRSWRGG